MSTKKIVIYILMILISFNLLATEIDSKEKKVLILFSGSHECLENRNMYLIFEKVLKPNNIRVASEYLCDTSRIYESSKQVFLDFYKEKYGEHNKFDVVIAFNKEAIDLCVNYGEEMFPDSNIIILDILGQISLDPPYDQQIDIITNLHKDLEYLLIVSDNSNRGRILKSNVKEYVDSLSTLKDKTIYVDFEEKDFTDINTYRYFSTKKSVVLLLSAQKDASLNEKEYPDQIKFLNKELNLPIYTLYEKYDNVDVIGGYYLDVDIMVKQLSVKVLLILNNMPLNKVDFSDMDFFKLFFNEEVADKYHINLEQYADKANIVTKESSGNAIKLLITIGRKVLLVSVFILIGALFYVNTKNKKNRKELKQYLDATNQIFNKSMQYILIVDTKSNIIINYNQRIAKSDFRDYIIKNETKITEFFPAKITNIINQTEYDAFSQIHKIEFSSNNSTFPAFLVSLKYLNNGQEVTYIQFINSSVYEQEILDLEKKIADYEKKVNESTNLIDNLVREVRNPLNVKKGFEQLLDNHDLTEQQRLEYLGIVHTNSHKLINIIEKVLVFNELTNNSKILNNQQFQLNKCIRKVTNKIQQVINEKEQNVKLINYFSLTEGKDELFNNKECFSLVLEELLSNAVKFTEQGIIECGYTHPNDGKIIFYIKDSGVGMNGEEQREAFNKFNFQSSYENSNTKSGIGIGLAICRNLITKMGGNIWLTSNENEGTTVYFYLDYDMSIFNHPQDLMQQCDIDRIKLKEILIIDEDLGTQKFITQTLKKYDVSAKTMPNYQFYSKYRKEKKHFNLIYFGYCSGFEDFIRENKGIIKESRVCIVIMTRTIISEDIIKELQGIHYTIIYKPIKLQELYRTFTKSCE